MKTNNAKTSFSRAEATLHAFFPRRSFNGKCGEVAILFLLFLAVATKTWAEKPSQDEMATKREWVAATFEPLPASKPVLNPGLEVVSNHDPVLKDARFTSPLRLGTNQFCRGLFCHAVSKVIVRLPRPGKTLAAVIGVDAAAGGGSVVFGVSAAGKELFKSEVLRGGQAGVPMSVDLQGITEFSLEVGDAGDGIACDQADWADAKVLLADGSELWVSDLPLAGGPTLAEPGQAPFSFTYDGKPSAEWLKTWTLSRSSRSLDDTRKEHTLSWTDTKTGLQTRCVAIEYLDFPTVEWTLYFKNTGTRDTPILENIQALEINMERGDLGEFNLHHSVGSPADGTDYAPRETRLAPNTTKRIAAAGGRPSNSDMPYFNIESTTDDGLIAVVGWPGQWAADFVRDGAKKLHIRAGQELTRLKLMPGEEIRTPLAVLQFWKKDWVRAQNIWRRWMMAHSMPKPGGQLPQPMVFGCSSRAYEEMIKADTDTQKMFIDRYAEEGIKLDYWWMDAGWYVQRNGWPQVGTWEVDQKRFPGGLRPISDHAHAKGVKILVWFEPERVAEGTWLSENHPEWILGGAKGGLLNLGDDAALKWLIEHIDQLITEQGIDLYRQDFNMDPLALWRAHDAPDRQGITEIRHVTGYLAYWDELRRRHPSMLIDSCASGGRRNDLETMRRSVPLWRSDYAFEPIGHQGMTYGLSFWIPFHGTGTVACEDAGYYGGGATPVQPYAFWSNVAPGLNCGFDVRERSLDYAALRALFAQFRAVSPNYYGDYYPLTKYSLDKSDWIAWQFNRPEAGKGMVQVFRRAGSNFLSGAFPLRGLDKDARYTVTELGSQTTRTLSGGELMKDGLVVTIAQKPGAAILIYEKL
jgi:alpha-galactosidase